MSTIWIIKREDKRGGTLRLVHNSVNNYWMARVQIDGERIYRNRSTATDDMDKARVDALDFFYGLTGRKSSGLSLDVIKVSDVAEQYVSVLKMRKMSGEINYVNDKITFVQKFIMGYFADRPIDSLTEKDTSAFAQWVQLYNVNGPNKNLDHVKTGNRISKLRKRPLSPNLVNKVLSELNQMLDWAIKEGHLPRNRKPYLERMKQKIKPRSAISKGQFSVIRANAQAFINDAKSEDGRYQRTLMTYFVRFCIGSGVRLFKETASMKWEHVEQGIKGNRQYTNIFIPKGKTEGSRREVVLRQGAQEALNEWRAISKHTKPEDYIWCHSDGSQLKSPNVTFKSYMKFCGTTKDRGGQPITPYSMRHTYITFMVADGVPMSTVAINAGTSVKMIEQFYSKVHPLDRVEILTGDDDFYHVT